MTLMQKLKINI